MSLLLGCPVVVVIVALVAITDLLLRLQSESSDERAFGLTLLLLLQLGGYCRRNSHEADRPRVRPDGRRRLHERQVAQEQVAVEARPPAEGSRRSAL